MGMLTTAAGPKEIKYLFVDGASLSCLLEDISKRYFDGVSIEIDYSQLGSSFTKIFYYDAIPVKNPDELEPEYAKRIAGKEKLLRHIRSFDRYHVYEGDARRRKGRGLEQKKVDVLITVDMLMHSFRRNMHQATLLTGDLDFKPLIDALVQDGMFITLWYPQNATSDELITAADARLALNIQSIHTYFSKGFESRYPTPRAFLSPDRHVENYSLVATSQNNPDITVELYQSDKDYLAIFADPTERSNYLYHLSCPDLERLRRYAEDLYRVRVPLSY